MELRESCILGAVVAGVHRRYRRLFSCLCYLVDKLLPDPRFVTPNLTLKVFSSIDLAGYLQLQSHWIHPQIHWQCSRIPLALPAYHILWHHSTVSFPFFRSRMNRGYRLLIREYFLGFLFPRREGPGRLRIKPLPPRLSHEVFGRDSRPKTLLNSGISCSQVHTRRTSCASIQAFSAKLYCGVVRGAMVVWFAFDVGKEMVGWRDSEPSDGVDVDVGKRMGWEWEAIYISGGFDKQFPPPPYQKAFSRTPL